MELLDHVNYFFIKLLYCFTEQLSKFKFVPRVHKCSSFSTSSPTSVIPVLFRVTHGHHQMVKTEIRLIIFFAAKDGEALYSQQKQDQEQTVDHIMNSLLLNSDLN